MCKLNYYVYIYVYIYNATYCIGPVPGGEHGALRRRRGSLDRLKAPQALQQSVQALASLPAQTPLNVRLSATSSLSLHTEEGGSGGGGGYTLTTRRRGAGTQ